MYAPLRPGSRVGQTCCFLACRKGAHIPAKNAGTYAPPAIDIHEADKVDEAALKDLIRAAVALNLMGKSKPKPRRASRKRASLSRGDGPPPEGSGPQGGRRGD
jgi:hypothetical protein